MHIAFCAFLQLQSARSVWRQRLCHRHRFRPRACCNLHGACGGKASERCVEHGRLRCNLHGACGGKGESIGIKLCAKNVAICTERVEAKHVGVSTPRRRLSCNLHGACGGKGGWKRKFLQRKRCNLHGACGGKVKRSQERGGKLHVAICTGRAEKPNGIIPRKNPRKFMQTYCIFIHLGV